MNILHTPKKKKSLDVRNHPPPPHIKNRFPLSISDRREPCSYIEFPIILENFDMLTSRDFRNLGTKVFMWPVHEGNVVHYWCNLKHHMTTGQLKMFILQQKLPPFLQYIPKHHPNLFTRCWQPLSCPAQATCSDVTADLFLLTNTTSPTQEGQSLSYL
jgi:hypothetical protein